MCLNFGLIHVIFNPYEHGVRKSLYLIETIELFAWHELRYIYKHQQPETEYKMKTQNNKLTIDDKAGFLMGTVIFVFTLPMALLFSYFFEQIIGGSISNGVLSTAVILLFLGMGSAVNFVLSLLVGLMVSYGICWVARKMQLPALLDSIKHYRQPIEAQRYVSMGATVGLICAAILFTVTGHVPTDAVTAKVGQLFPTPIVINLGSAASLDLSHTYAAFTGFLTVGGLFIVSGICLGSLVAAMLERVLDRQAF